MTQHNPLPASRPWEVCDRFLDLNTPWFVLVGEHLLSDRQQLLEYWRIEKANSVIVLPIGQQCFWLPSPMYRPGVGTSTLDFPGGRIQSEQGPEDAANVVLQRELGVDPGAIAHLTPLNPEGWAVNSSFSNQRLYGFVAHIEGAALTRSSHISYPVTEQGVRSLLADLDCLQCRAVLLEWWLKNRH